MTNYRVAVYTTSVQVIASFAMRPAVCIPSGIFGITTLSCVSTAITGSSFIADSIEISITITIEVLAAISIFISISVYIAVVIAIDNGIVVTITIAIDVSNVIVIYTYLVIAVIYDTGFYL